MADKLNLGSEVRELKLGPSFSNNKGSAFHTLRYDFKPASVDPRESATLDVGPNHEVTVTVPNAGGGAGGRTVFKGSHRPYQRECVLIIDKTTGEITLEKLTHNIQLKKTRAEQTKASQAPQPATLTEKKPSPPRPQGRGGQGSGSGGGKKNKGGGGPGSLGRPLPKHSPLPASPSYPGKSPAPAPAAYKSPPQINMSPVGAAGSLPMIGLDDPCDMFPSPAPTTERTSIPSGTPSPYFGGPAAFEHDEDRGAISRVGVLSGSSSSSGSSDDSSDSDSDAPAAPRSHGRPPAPAPAHKRPPTANGHVNGNLQAADVLKADLELSESGSELD